MGRKGIGADAHTQIEWQVNYSKIVEGHNLFRLDL